eukprot:632729-Hanusia_phi.AAC.2
MAAEPMIAYTPGVMQGSCPAHSAKKPTSPTRSWEDGSQRTSTGGGDGGGKGGGGEGERTGSERGRRIGRWGQRNKCVSLRFPFHSPSTPPFLLVLVLLSPAPD